MGYIEFWVVFVIENSIKLQILVLEEKSISYGIHVFFPTEQAIKVYTTTFYFLTVQALEIGYK